ncbi:MAG: XrtA/PEP-CTERM system histidine kinase PrsK [Pseudomonadota bacterium]
MSMGFIQAGYLTAAVAWLMLAGMLVVNRRFHWPDNFVIAMATLMAGWAAVMAWAALYVSSIGLIIGIDTIHGAALLLFLGQLVSRGNTNPWRRWFSNAPWLLLVVSAFLIWRSLVSDSIDFNFLYYFIVGISIIGLLAVEQIYRNADRPGRRLATLVATSFGFVLTFDLFVYSNAILLGALDEQLWAVRGFVNALVVPVLLFALKQNISSERGLFVSRQVVFYSSTLIGVGAYLVVVAFAGAFIQERGGEWGGQLRGLFFVASLLLLVLTLFSPLLRRRLRVFIATHFYANRYDYREEWLKLIRRLAQDNRRAPMPNLCLDALADILESPAAVLWIKASEGGVYDQAAMLGSDSAPETLTEDDPVIGFLLQRDWVIDGREALRDPEHYDHWFDVSKDRVVTHDRIIVPMMLEGELAGVAALVRPSGLPLLNFEDHDLLRTVGQQLAVFLQRDRTRDQLAEAREFDVFNRFTAFIMHDLKNLIAQQSLVVKNAEKHKSNPAFIDDAISTIANSVSRMEKLLAALNRQNEPESVRTIALCELLKRVVEDASNRKPVPKLKCEIEGVMVNADPERLGAVLGHLVRNAQDATIEQTGAVYVELTNDSENAMVRIQDEGIGMTGTFVREQLFRPFISTKGAQGMGIGAYQAREYVSQLNGTLAVDSSVGEGTEFVVSLPLAKS